MLDYKAMAIDIIHRLENMSKEEYIAFMKKCGVNLVDVKESDSDTEEFATDDPKDDNRPGPFMQMYYDFYSINPEDIL